MPIARVVLKGTRHYCASSAARRGDLRAGARLTLIAEVGNPYDANAVEVRLAATNEKLGYLSRQIAPRYRQRIQSGSISDAKIVDADMARGPDGLPRLRLEIFIEYQDPKVDARPVLSKPILSNKEIPSSPGVYALINDSTHRSYIGSSKNVKARVAQHFRDLGQGSHANALLQRDYTIQRGEGFSATVIQRLQRPEQCELAESRAIAAALRQSQKLYNMTEDGQGSAAARFGTTIDIDAAGPVSDRVDHSQQRNRTGRDATATVGANGGKSTDLLQRPIVPVPQGNPDMRWLWIIGGIVLLVLLFRGR
jgi:hypothetical protein